MKRILILSMGCLMLASCRLPEKQDNDIIGPADINLESDLLTPELMWAFGRVGDIQISPDNQTILFGVTWYDWKANKGNRELYTMKMDGSDRKPITKTSKSEYNGVWRPDGKKIGFLYPDSDGNMQLFEMNPDGSARIQITKIEGGITGFSYAPDQKSVLYSRELKSNTTPQDVYPDLDKANARLVEDLMFRHWDTWVETVSHLFVASYEDGKIGKETDILKDEPFESPMKPWGGMEQTSWSPDGKSLVYTCRKKTGVEYALSTNSDLFLYTLADGKTKNLTDSMMGYDWNPVFSPDGKKIAWESMERDGYEADKLRLFVLDLNTGIKTYHTANFDQNVASLRWADDSKSLFFISDWHATEEIYQIWLDTDSIRKITNGVHDYVAAEPIGNKLIGINHSMSKPDEIYSIDLATGKETELSFINKKLLDQLTMGEVKERWVKTTDGKDMLVWVIYPPHFDSTKTYPALLYCQGGPQGTVSQFWSYRWNFQIMAANGYIIVAPNRRGLPGFGQEWNEQISGDYGGQNMKDYLSAIDAVSAEPYVDKENLGAVGASYGGFSVFWLAGHHEGRFKAFIAHDGMFNLESQYLETEELWFTNWDLGGPYWQKDNAIAQRSYANSPHLFVDKWDTPILIFHGELDYRIAYTQAMQAFTAAQMRGIPSKLVLFPEENHWVLKPQNAILWQREFFGWLDKWLKKDK